MKENTEQTVLYEVVIMRSTLRDATRLADALELVMVEDVVVREVVV